MMKENDECHDIIKPLFIIQNTKHYYILSEQEKIIIFANKKNNNMENNNHKKRITMCEFALSYLNEEARYISMSLFHACLSAHFSMEDETVQDKWIKSIIEDLKEDDLVKTEDKLIKITMKGRRMLSSGGYEVYYRQ